MLKSVWTKECEGARRLLGAALSLLLVLRVLLQPLFLPPPEPGSIPLCNGTEVLWILPDGASPEDGDATRAPCPYLGLAADMPPLFASITPPRSVVRPARALLPETRLRLARHMHAPHAPRAPPEPPTA